MIEALIAITVVAAFFVGAVVWRLRRDRREHSGRGSETAKAGVGGELDGDEAARRALDRTAWSRIYGP